MPKFIGKLQSVEVGHVIIIAGRTAVNASSFFVELRSSNNPENSSLHILVQFDKKIITRCVKVGGVGQHEDHETTLIETNDLNPIKPGEDFKIALYVDVNQFFITIKNKPFCSYSRHRSLSDINEIASNADEVVQFHHIDARSSKLQTSIKSTFSSIVPSQFRPGNVIVISGTPRENKSGYISIDFYKAGSNEILFHLGSTIERKALDESSS
jgi:hypothetical protein